MLTVAKIPEGVQTNVDVDSGLNINFRIQLVLTRHAIRSGCEYLNFSKREANKKKIVKAKAWKYKSDSENPPPVFQF